MAESQRPDDGAPASVIAGPCSVVLSTPAAGTRYRRPMQTPPTLEAARSVLSVRPMGALTLQQRHLSLALRGALAGLDVVQPVVADLSVGLFLDLPGLDTAVSPTDLARWGVSLPQALNAAVAAGFGRPVPEPERVESVRLFRDVRFAGTALLRPELIRALPIDGNPVVLIPTIGDLLVGSADDPAGMSFMVRMAERIVESGNLPVSIQPLTLRGLEWTPFSWPAATQPFADALRRRWDTLQYAAQQPLLREHYERTRQDYFVPELRLFAKDGQSVTLTTLTQGVPTVLPLADAVNLVRDGGQVARVPMSALLGIPGLIVPVPNTAPARVYATRFPLELFG